MSAFVVPADSAGLPCSSVDEAITVSVTAEPPPVRRPSQPKSNARDAWSTWRATRTAASGAQFCLYVAAWTQGTAAQLLRAPWPTGVVRPSQTDVEARLREDLELVVDLEPDYVEALGVARRDVLEQLRKARQPIEASPGA